MREFSKHLLLYYIHTVMNVILLIIVKWMWLSFVELLALSVKSKAIWDTLVPPGVCLTCYWLDLLVWADFLVFIYWYISQLNINKCVILTNDSHNLSNT